MKQYFFLKIQVECDRLTVVAMKQTVTGYTIDTGYTNVVAVALAKTAANYFVILISM